MPGFFSFSEHTFKLSNEGLSLRENAAHLGLPVAKNLKTVLDQLHEKHEYLDK